MTPPFLIPPSGDKTKTTLTPRGHIWRGHIRGVVPPLQLVMGKKSGVFLKYPLSPPPKQAILFVEPFWP